MFYYLNNPPGSKFVFSKLNGKKVVINELTLLSGRVD